MNIKSCCPARANTRRIVIDGQEVGIVGLDAILQRVKGSLHLGEEEIRELVLEGLRASNYVPREAENAYVEAVLHEIEERHR